MKNKLVLFILPIFLIPSISKADFGESLYNKIGFGATNESKVITKKNYSQWLNIQLSPPNEDLEIEKKYKLPRNNEDIYKTYLKYDFNIHNGDIDFKSFQLGPDSLYEKNLNRRIDYALNSDWRIREFMVWFWYNHFNNGPNVKTTSLIFLSNYEDIVRSNALGNFKELLYKISTNPGMVYYLDNDKNRINSKVGINELNENLAREFLELHTMGVDSGYTQEDIINLAKVLSGHTLLTSLDIDHNLTESDTKGYTDFKNEAVSYLNHKKTDYFIEDFYLYREDNHSKEKKIILGKEIKLNGREELKEAIDIITNDPRTAHFLSKKIANYFLSDNVNEVLIDKMSKTFLETEGDISKTVKVLLTSKEFIDSVGKNTKTKDSYNYIISTLRTPFSKEVREDPANIKLVSSFLRSIKAEPYYIDTPQGFNIEDLFWKNPTRLQEYIFFTQYFFNDPLKTDKGKYFNYPLISKVAGHTVSNVKEAVLFFTSQKWLGR